MQTPLVAEESSAPISAAEQAVFVDPHLTRLHLPARLRYRFERTDAQDSSTAFTDAVELKLGAQHGGHCCIAHVNFLSGPHALAMPDIDDARANPVTMYFLEREVRELERLTGGQSAHFRRRIRLALAEDASVMPVTVRYGGHDVPATRITIAPYVKDPQRARFDRFASMQYEFVLSRQVPGGVYSLRSRLPAGNDTAVLSEESLTLTPAVPRS